MYCVADTYTAVCMQFHLLLLKLSWTEQCKHDQHSPVPLSSQSGPLAAQLTELIS